MQSDLHRAYSAETDPILEDGMSDVADAIVDERSGVNKCVLVDRKLRVRPERVQRFVHLLSKVDDDCNKHISFHSAHRYTHSTDNHNRLMS